jgi:hypothetical protein
MGAGAYRRGSCRVAREADARMVSALERAGRQALEEEAARLRARVGVLEHDLRRARRCLAAERYARQKRTAELEAEVRSSACAVSILCRAHFGDEGSKV